MSGWASVAAELGATVSGSDAADSQILAALRERGIEAKAGHCASNLPTVDGTEVVRSSAIPDSNPELIAARERGLPVMERAELWLDQRCIEHLLAEAAGRADRPATHDCRRRRARQDDDHEHGRAALDRVWARPRLPDWR